MYTKVKNAFNQITHPPQSDPYSTTWYLDNMIHATIRCPPQSPHPSTQPQPQPRSFLVPDEGLPRRRELPQLVPHHLLLDVDVVVDLAVVHLEPQPHEAGQDGRRARPRADGRRALPGLGADDREAVRC